MVASLTLFVLCVWKKYKKIISSETDKGVITLKASVIITTLGEGWKSL